MSRRDRNRRLRHQAHPMRRAVLVFAGVLTVGLVAGATVFGAWIVRVVDDTPNIDQLRPKPQPSVSIVYGADGSRLGFITGDTVRLPVNGRGVPPALRRATVAIEDRRFYHHGGVDMLGVARAAAENVVNGRTVQGGSSLTMQLVRNLYLPHTRYQKTLERKVREAKLADQLENEHSKAWILSQYLDNVPYGTVGGQTAVGVQAASRLFFDKPVDELTLSQSALLAGLPQAPTLDNPFLHPHRARQRRNEVLHAMAKARAITPGQALEAARTPLGVRRNSFFQQRSDPYVVDFVEQELRRRYGEAALKQGGFKIQTSIDPRLQRLGRAAIADHLNQPGQPSAALTSIDPSNGHIRALVTSTAYDKSEFNYATSAHRQAGSTFKAIDLMAAVRKGINPDTTYYDSRPLGAGWLPREPTWSVATDDHTYRGSISLSEAIAVSDNTVYAQLGADLGGDAIRRAAYDMGVTSHLDGFPAESIGGLRIGVTPLEMADAYATIADGGWRNTATAIVRVTLDGKTVEPKVPATRRRKFTDGQAARVTKALEGVLDHGTAAGLGIGCPAAGKTGTTSSFTDAWFIGYTPKLSTSVWVGYPTETASMSSVPGYGEVFGATIPAPIWQQYMEGAIGNDCVSFPSPKNGFSATPFRGSRSTTGSPSSGGSGDVSGSGGSGSGGGGGSSGSGSSGSGSGGGTGSPGSASSGSYGGGSVNGGNSGSGSYGGGGGGTGGSGGGSFSGGGGGGGGTSGGSGGGSTGGGSGGSGGGGSTGGGSGGNSGGGSGGSGNSGGGSGGSGGGGSGGGGGGFGGAGTGGSGGGSGGSGGGAGTGGSGGGGSGGGGSGGGGSGGAGSGGTGSGGTGSGGAGSGGG
jgi:penicillin-binding protein 1A